MRSRAMLFALTMLGASMGMGGGIGHSSSYNGRREDFLEKATNRLQDTLTLPKSEVIGVLGKQLTSVTFTHTLGKYDISYTIDVVANSDKALYKKTKLYSFQISHYISANYNKEHLLSKGFIVNDKVDDKPNED